MRNKILDLFTNLIYQIALYGSGLASAGFSYQPKLSEQGEYYGAAEPPVRCGESHLSGLTEPPHFVY